MNIYVGNLSFDETDESLETSFSNHGEVQSARVITDRYTGRSRGFGFVEMPNQEEALAAIAAMNGADLGGRPAHVECDRVVEANRAGQRAASDHARRGARFQHVHAVIARLGNVVEAAGRLDHQKGTGKGRCLQVVTDLA